MGEKRRRAILERDFVEGAETDRMKNIAPSIVSTKLSKRSSSLKYCCDGIRLQKFLQAKKSYRVSLLPYPLIKSFYKIF